MIDKMLERFSPEETLDPEIKDGPHFSLPPCSGMYE